MTETTKLEKVMVIAIFGFMAAYSFFLGKFEMGMTLLMTLATYFMSREGV